MKTKSITLFYTVNQQQIIPPLKADIERKDKWIKEVQRTIDAEWNSELIKVTYSVFNPHIQDQVRFFNGTVVAYYAIQNEDMVEGIPSRELLEQYREEMLDELLGYDYKTVHKVIRKRKSTGDFKSVQAWNNFLKLCEETLFESAGYEFPDSEVFWELVKEIGYDNAKQESIKRLQISIKRRNESR